VKPDPTNCSDYVEPDNGEGECPDAPNAADITLDWTGGTCCWHFNGTDWDPVSNSCDDFSGCHPPLGHDFATEYALTLCCLFASKQSAIRTS
jgi:hypothetical protein